MRHTPISHKPVNGTLRPHVLPKELSVELDHMNTRPVFLSNRAIGWFRLTIFAATVLARGNFFVFKAKLRRFKGAIIVCHHDTDLGAT